MILISEPRKLQEYEDGARSPTLDGYRVARVPLRRLTYGLSLRGGRRVVREPWPTEGARRCSPYFPCTKVINESVLSPHGHLTYQFFSSVTGQA